MKKEKNQQTVYPKITDFETRYKSREAKVAALQQMTQEEIQALIEESPNIHHKIWLSRFLK